MLRRNVDFFALLFIVAGMFAFSSLPAVGLPRAPQPIRFQNAMKSDPCPISAELLSRLDFLLNP